MILCNTATACWSDHFGSLAYWVPASNATRNIAHTMRKSTGLYCNWLKYRQKWKTCNLRL